MQSVSTVLILLVILILLIAGCASQPTPIAPPTSAPHLMSSVSTALKTITGNSPNQISNLEENMPRSESEGYVIPTKEEQANFARLVSLINANDLARAAELAGKNNYALTYYVDHSDGNATSYLLREQKPVQYGWGLYIFRVDSSSNIIIEAPHPKYDRRTPSVALDLYRALNARALLIAGAHRNANQDGSADVAHAKESIFQSVHISLTKELQDGSGDLVVLQIHGFHSTKHDGYPQVVFGLGKNALPREVALAEKMKDALVEQGISAGICLGETLQDLCAETNVQGAVTEEAAFIHIEMDENLRKDDKAFIAALVGVFGK